MTKFIFGLLGVIFLLLAFDSLINIWGAGINYMATGLHSFLIESLLAVAFGVTAYKV